MSGEPTPDARPPTVLRLLPGFQLEFDGDPVPVTHSVSRLVTFLALQRGPIERAYVAAQLAAGHDEKRANAKLRTTLWRLGGLADDLVVSDGSQLSLRHGVQVDLFDRMEMARQAVDLDHDVGSVSPSSVVTLIEGLSVDLLLGWYDEWLLIHQSRWRQLRMNALEALSDQLRIRGRYYEAKEAALAAAEVEPLRETPRRCMIKAHLAEGNVFEALRVYQDFAQCLFDELEVEPSPMLAELFSAVLSDDRLNSSAN